MYHEYIFRPLYNGLVLILNVFPWADVGIAVIIFTVIVKIILYPLSKSALLTQIRMKDIEPEVNKIRNQYANDKQLQAVKTMELYKSQNIKPFSGVLLLFIQLPILLALISVLYKVIPTVDATLLYSFIGIPVLKTTFIGLVDLTKPSLILAIMTGVIQFLQLKYSLSSRTMSKSAGAQASSVASSMNMMNAQMKYFIPVIAFVSIYWVIPSGASAAASSIIAIYWMTSSLVTLLQELYIGKRHIESKAN